jgi:formylglycine-generating enzyme required for sulfatase activity
MAPKDATEWAKVRGEDEYGLFVDFEYKDVCQRMRWVMPGRFWMGSPESEPERSNDEVLHEVELTEGYWLADTACTQELWMAVMGKNPSKFREQGPGENSRPVEQVSWDDCQEFLRRLNGVVPRVDGVCFRLPTDAEWEYACRAGTRTPFSFGVNVTTDQVNYNGYYPYAGGKRGKHRGKTIPVKSLPANSWGFFEMHGNVWEFCSSVFDKHKPRLVVDSFRDFDDIEGRLRVIRGGCFLSCARYVRSAYHGENLPGYRGEELGFRFAWG